MTVKKKSEYKVLILMGSASDAGIMRAAYDVLNDFGVPVKMAVSSAHRTHERTARLVKQAVKDGAKCFIIGAGMAAHLAGVVAAQTTLPVIGVPIDASTLGGLDALLSTVQMPPGVPVASMGIGKAGARNAGLFAVEMLASGDDKLQNKLVEFRKAQAKKVVDADRKLAKELEKG